MPLGWKITRIKGIYLLGLKIMPRMRTIVSRNRLLRSLPGWRIMLLLHLLTLINLRGWKLVLRAIIRRRGWKRQKVQQPIVAAMYLLGQKMQDEHNLPLNRISMPVSQQRINLHGWQKHNKTSVKVKLQVLRWPKETVKRESVQLLGPKTVTTAHRSKGTAGSDSKVSRYKSRKNSYKKKSSSKKLKRKRRREWRRRRRVWWDSLNKWGWRMSNLPRGRSSIFRRSWEKSKRDNNSREKRRKKRKENKRKDWRNSKSRSRDNKSYRSRSHCNNKTKSSPSQPSPRKSHPHQAVAKNQSSKVQKYRTFHQSKVLKM